MRKTLAALLLSTAIAVATVAPAWACTPPLDLDIWGDLTPPSQIDYTPSEDIDKACDNAAQKWLEEHPIDYTPESETEIRETETKIQETETESETIAETEQETAQKYMDWKKYIPESLRARWLNIVQR